MGYDFKVGQFVVFNKERSMNGNFRGFTKGMVGKIFFVDSGSVRARWYYEGNSSSYESWTVSNTEISVIPLTSETTLRIDTDFGEYHGLRCHVVSKTDLYGITSDGIDLQMKVDIPGIITGALLPYSTLTPDNSFYRIRDVEETEPKRGGVMEQMMETTMWKDPPEENPIKKIRRRRQGPGYEGSESQRLVWLDYLELGQAKKPPKAGLEVTDDHTSVHGQTKHRRTGYVDVPRAVSI